MSPGLENSACMVDLLGREGMKLRGLLNQHLIQLYRELCLGHVAYHVEIGRIKLQRGFEMGQEHE